MRVLTLTRQINIKTLFILTDSIIVNIYSWRVTLTKNVPTMQIEA